MAERTVKLATQHKIEILNLTRNGAEAERLPEEMLSRFKSKKRRPVAVKRDLNGRVVDAMFIPKNKRDNEGEALLWARKEFEEKTS